VLERLTRNHLALIGLVALALTGVLGNYGLRLAFGQYADGYDLTAAFSGAGQNLDTQSAVKMRGVDVGQVDGIRLDHNRALVTLRIDPGVEVPATTTAVIRPISIFGPKFVDLVPGRGEGQGPYLEDGDEIERTRASLELGDILGEASRLLGAVEPDDMTTMLHTFAEGVDGLDEEMSSGITDGLRVLDATIRSTDDRHRLLANLAVLAGHLADDGQTIVETGGNVHRSLPLLSEHEDDFAGLLDATSRLSSDLADILGANADVLGPATDAGARLADITASDLQGLVAYIDFVQTYGHAIGNTIRVPVVGEAFLLATQQFLLPTDPCQALVRIPDCHVEPIDPGPQVAGRSTDTTR